jgi:hypothetical protein
LLHHQRGNEQPGDRSERQLVRADQYRRVRPAGGRLRCEHPVIDFYYWTLGGDTLSYGTAPIPAGWSNGTGPVRVVPQPDPQDYTLDAEGYVALKVASGLQVNSSFNITLWASDGTTTQTETVPVVIQAPCKRHY